MHIEYINSTEPTVDYSLEAIREHEQGRGSGIERYTERFEREFQLPQGEDMGGLIVYQNGTVYDYENFKGWIPEPRARKGRLA